MSSELMEECNSKRTYLDGGIGTTRASGGCWHLIYPNLIMDPHSLMYIKMSVNINKWR